MNPGPLGKKHIKKKSTSPAVIEIGKYMYVPYYGNKYTYIILNKMFRVQKKFIDNIILPFINVLLYIIYNNLNSYLV